MTRVVKEFITLKSLLHQQTPTSRSHTCGSCQICSGIKVHNKGNELESSQNHPHLSPWENCLPQNWSLLPKRLETTVLLIHPPQSAKETYQLHFKIKYDYFSPVLTTQS